MSMTRPQTTVLVIASGSRRSVRLEFSSVGESVKRRRGEMDRESNISRPHHARSLVRHPAVADAAREPRRGREFLRRPQAAAGAGADEYRVQKASSSAINSPIRREGVRGAGRLRVPCVVEVVGDETATPSSRTASPSTRPTRSSMPATISLQDAVAAGSDAAIADVTVHPGRSRVLHLHRGNDRSVEGCMLSHNYIASSWPTRSARCRQRRADDVALTPLPLFHFNAISVCVVGHVVGRRAGVDRAPVSGQ